MTNDSALYGDRSWIRTETPELHPVDKNRLDGTIVYTAKDKSGETAFSKAFIPKGSITKRSYIIIAVCSFAAVFGLWCYACFVMHVSSMFLPSPKEVVQSAAAMFTDGNFLFDIRMSVQRVLIGFLISAVVGIPFGLIIGTYAPMAAGLEPLFSFFRYLPASAFIQLFILWIGIGEGSKISIIIVGSLAQIILMVATNVRNVSGSLIEVSYTLGVSRAGVFWKVILRKAMPDIMDTLRMVLGWAWTYIIVAEMIGASEGVGFMITQAGRQFRISRIFVGIIVIGLIGLVLDMLMMFLKRALFPWNEEK